MNDRSREPDESCLPVDPARVLGRRLVALRQTPWFAPCHRQVGATDFTCRAVLELEGGALVELDQRGLWIFEDSAEILERVNPAEHRFESLRPTPDAAVLAVLTPEAAGGALAAGIPGPPLVVLDQGSFLTLDPPPGVRFWVGDLEDLVQPRAGADEASGAEILAPQWVDFWSGEPVALRSFLPLAVALPSLLGARAGRAAPPS